MHLTPTKNQQSCTELGKMTQHYEKKINQLKLNQNDIDDRISRQEQ